MERLSTIRGARIRSRDWRVKKAEEIVWNDLLARHDSRADERGHHFIELQAYD